MSRPAARASIGLLWLPIGLLAGGCLESDVGRTDAAPGDAAAEGEGGDGGAGEGEGEAGAGGGGGGSVGGDEGEGEGAPAEGEGEGEGDAGPDLEAFRADCAAVCEVVDECGLRRAFLPGEAAGDCVEICLRRHAELADPEAYSIVTTCILGGAEDEGGGRCGRVRHCAGANLVPPEECADICAAAAGCEAIGPFEEGSLAWLSTDAACPYRCAGFLWLVGPYAERQGWVLDPEWAACTAGRIAGGLCSDAAMAPCFVDADPVCDAVADMLDRCTPPERRGDDFDADAFGVWCTFARIERAAGRPAELPFTDAFLECVAAQDASRPDEQYCGAAWTACVDPTCRRTAEFFERCVPAEDRDEDFDPAGFAVFCDGQLGLPEDQRSDDFDLRAIQCIADTDADRPDGPYCADVWTRCGPFADACDRACDKLAECGREHPFGDGACPDACRAAGAQAGDEGGGDGGPGGWSPFRMQLVCIEDGWCEHLDACTALPAAPAPGCVALCEGPVAACGFTELGDDPDDPQGEGQDPADVVAGCVLGCSATLPGRGLLIDDVAPCVEAALADHCGDGGDGDLDAAEEGLFACVSSDTCLAGCAALAACGATGPRGEVGCQARCGEGLSRHPVGVAAVLECIDAADGQCEVAVACVPEDDDDAGEGEGGGGGR